jgi:hypothetical protein
MAAPVFKPEAAMHGAAIFFSFWWLIFPIMGFASYGFRIWAAHRQSQQAMEILRTYAAQGKEPPPEVMAAVTGMQAGGVPPGGNPYNAPYGNAPYGPGPYGGPWGGGWGWGRGGWAGRGPLWAWSRVVTFAAIAIGFSFAGQYWGDADADAVKAFHLVAIIMGVLAVGFGIVALMHTLFYRNAPKP